MLLSWVAGEPFQHVYFILSGQVRLVRNVHVDEAKLALPPIAGEPVG